MRSEFPSVGWWFIVRDCPSGFVMNQWDAEYFGIPYAREALEISHSTSGGNCPGSAHEEIKDDSDLQVKICSHDPIRQPHSGDVGTDRDSVRARTLSGRSLPNGTLKRNDRKCFEGSIPHHPILSISPEITTEIFIQCLPPHGRVRLSPTDAPLSLAQLWSSLDLVFLKNPIFHGLASEGCMGGRISLEDIHFNGAPHLIRTWFKRSDRCLLCLTLRAPLGYFPMPDIISLVHSFAGTISRLELQLDPENLALLRPTRPSLCCLTELAIHSRLNHLDGLRMFFFADAPVLAKLRVPGNVLRHIDLSRHPLLTAQHRRWMVEPSTRDVWHSPSAVGGSDAGSWVTPNHYYGDIRCNIFRFRHGVPAEVLLWSPPLAASTSLQNFLSINLTLVGLSCIPITPEGTWLRGMIENDVKREGEMDGEISGLFTGGGWECTGKREFRAKRLHGKGQQARGELSPHARQGHGGIDGTEPTVAVSDVDRIPSSNYIEGTKGLTLSGTSSGSMSAYQENLKYYEVQVEAMMGSRGLWWSMVVLPLDAVRMTVYVALWWVIELLSGFF
ncbi:hypothetical protein B0H13DRAFT_1907017 [Mycena leptocephala]|nr:hypothetical protein B0H13DRAFT_1907017 [Mycena leptocephala]